MPQIQYIEEDFVVVRREPDSDADRRVTLTFGDPVHKLDHEHGWTTVEVLSYYDGPFTGFVKGDLPVRDEPILTFSMIDVQQGDGLILQTPGGQIVLIDGGDNSLFARHAAARFRHRLSSKDEPLEVDAIIVTHGDADHFDGLNDIRRSEDLPARMARKRLFIHPKRVFHNGLVKSPARDENSQLIPDTDRFGRTVEQGKGLSVVDLYDDPRNAQPEAMGAPFERWAKSLDHWEQRGNIELKRVAFGMDEGELFGFLEDEGIQVEVLGPFATEVVDPDDGSLKPALPFLHEPERSAVIHLERGGGDDGGLSASHTINGHSIALRLTYGNVRFSLTGDLNQEAMDLMLQNLGTDMLEAEIVKAPHHGSADFDLRALEAMKPVVAIVSSGDENAMKEYIHPRATLMAALGMSMRGDTGIVLCTELAAFFATKQWCYTRDGLAEFFKERKDQQFSGEDLRKLFSGVPREGDPKGMFYGFERKNFGIIHIRSDGERVLVFTHSGRAGLNEAYRFTVTMEQDERVVKFAERVVTR
jgi:hypothetical protein